ncbi:hypothetical protein [Synechococcus sp. C9]|uniref:hypothetical protein n=1 Tax=Synechococcus sp. C9 TaxID=102119 RepID=UPI001FF45097|nr:hypothetical protein [Synechococcus sp. C9]
MADREDLNRRLERLAVSRQQSWEAVREAQALVRAGIANFENRPPRWAKPAPVSPKTTPPLPTPRPWYERLSPRFWQALPIFIGTVLGLLLADWWGAW